MEKQLLTDPNSKPENNVLENALGKNFKNYAEFTEKIKALNLIPEWHYYNDGKSWLGKLLFKKKNLCWLSVWNTGFKLTFYFTEKTIGGIQDLDIDGEIKKSVKENKPVGKLIPILLLIGNKKKIRDALKLLEYKMRLK